MTAQPIIHSVFCTDAARELVNKFSGISLFAEIGLIESVDIIVSNKRTMVYEMLIEAFREIFFLKTGFNKNDPDGLGQSAFPRQT